jgi:hypothetical protein
MPPVQGVGGVAFRSLGLVSLQPEIEKVRCLQLSGGLCVEFHRAISGVMAPQQIGVGRIGEACVFGFDHVAHSQAFVMVRQQGQELPDLFGIEAAVCGELP